MTDINNFGNDRYKGVSFEEAMRCCAMCNSMVQQVARASRNDSIASEAFETFLVKRFACPECGNPNRRAVGHGQLFCRKAGDHRSPCHIGTAVDPRRS